MKATRLAAVWVFGALMLALIALGLRVLSHAPLPLFVLLGGFLLLSGLAVVAGTIHFSADIVTGRYPGAIAAGASPAKGRR